MAVVWADVSARWPVVASVAIAGQTAFLADAAREVSGTAWGADATRAQCALAAHLAIMSTRVNGGQVTGESLGPASISYAAPMLNTSLESTGPGQEFLRIRNGIAAFRFPTMPTTRGWTY